jgi:hypothetical protein
MKVNEFKIWLEGVLAFQENKTEWKPTAKQWKMIYEKILSLEESVVYQNEKPRVNSPIPRLDYQSEETELLPSQLLPPSEQYKTFSPQQLETLKQRAANGGGIDVPIVDTDTPKSPFI